MASIVPVVPGALEKLVMLRMNQAPGVFLDILGAAAFQTVMAALRLGVFEALAEQPRTVAETARALDLNERGTHALLEALVALGYARRGGARYDVTPLTRKWLLRDSPDSMAAGLEFWSMLLLDLWSSLDASVKEGAPPFDLYNGWLDERAGGWEAFQDFMITGARAMAKEIVRRVSLPAGARRLLDVGGGHGQYSIAFCEQHPELTATVLDLPGAIETAERELAGSRCADRVSTRSCDFWEEELGEGYDVVLLFNLLHTHQPPRNRELLRKVDAALAPGGRVIILEQLTAGIPGNFGRIFASVASLNYFHMVGGKGYSAAELRSLLEELRFVELTTLSLRSLPGNGLVMGTKSG